MKITRRQLRRMILKEYRALDHNDLLPLLSEPPKPGSLEAAMFRIAEIFGLSAIFGNKGDAISMVEEVLTAASPSQMTKLKDPKTTDDEIMKIFTELSGMTKL